jgi:hypothetical protein
LDIQKTRYIAFVISTAQLHLQSLPAYASRCFTLCEDDYS